MFLGLMVSSPWWVTRMLTTQRYREGLWQRLGAVPDSLRAFVRGKHVVWVHAVSVGEVLAATRLVAELEAALGNEWIVTISTTTRTGQALARQRFGAERVFYYPLDFAWAVRAYLRALRPAALVLMESELWPRMLHECGRAGVPVAVANARVSDRSFARGMKVRWAWGRALRKVSLWLAQSEEDARRLVAMGASPENVKVTGNLKYDVRAPKESRIAALIKEAAAGRPIVVAGSTVAVDSVDEEAIVIEAWKGSGALLVLAPRHPERFGMAEIRTSEFLCQKASAWAGSPTHDDETIMDGAPRTPLHPPLVKGQVEIVLLDTIGDLAAVYGIADVAFIGGSMVSRGGHNPLEPAQFGVPVVMGPHFQNFRNVVNAMEKANGIRIVPDNEGLETALKELLTDLPLAQALGESGRQEFLRQQGATMKSVSELRAIIERDGRERRTDPRC
jgi:3-deoxy-D-manno-octulosonic-acid transferase